MLGARLRELAERPQAGRLASDPLGLVRSARDREGAALVAASLAFGNVRTIRRSVATALRALEGDDEALAGFRHRWIDGDDVAALLSRIRETRKSFGGLEELFLAGDRGDLGGALDAFLGALRGPAPGKGLRYLLPLPRDGSACKRPLLFLRWVVRPADGVDLGLWKRVDPGRLVVPLDTHLHRISYWLGLTDRRTPSWRTAVDVTESLRRFDPDDPVRYDFALAHLGIARDCPRKPVAVTCDRCPLKPYCRAWEPATT